MLLLLPCTYYNILYTKFKNSRSVGAKIPLSLLENQSARQPCNVHASSPWEVAIAVSLRCWYACATRSVATCLKYMRHTRGKMRHLKPVCLTEMDIIASTPTTKNISPYLKLPVAIFGGPGSAPFSAGSHLRRE